jgi:hypothetical protein
VDVVRELADDSSNGAVLIDTLARALKDRGFSRPPGSPRLITRLRRIRELNVSRTGMITLSDAAAPGAAEARETSTDVEQLEIPDVADGAVEEEPTPGNEAVATEAGAPRSRSRRRRGRRRRGRGRRGGGAAAAPAPAPA